MKFRDPNTGCVFDSITAARAAHCVKYAFVPCRKCKLSRSANKENTICLYFVKDHPLEAARLMGYEIIEDEKENPMETTIKDSGIREPMGDTGFVRDNHTGKGRMDLLPWYAVIELAQHCENGALKYGERNIDKGAPLHSLLDSGARHLAKYIAGENDEDHLRAACWNLMFALNQRTTHPELNDMPWGTDHANDHG